ncbi:MAG TPA: hypothetical protein VK112_10345 [Fodinibius sp.]|nr:hypothetical protein [Fodinibius sp.]
MKLLKNSLTTLLVGLFLVGLTTSVNAQDKRAAVKTYNDALDLMEAQKYEQAADKLQQAIDQAEKLGAEGQDILDRTKKQMPSVYWGLAKKEYATFQSEKSISSLDATVAAFQEAGDVAEQYGSTKIAEKVPGIVTQLMYNKALVQSQKKNNQDALATLDQVIERNANYAKAYYQKGIITKNMDQGSLDKALSHFDKAAEVAESNGNSQMASQAQEAAADALVYRGSQAVQDKNYSKGLDLLNKALTYNDSSESAYFRMAEAYNGQQNWSKAAESAEKALDLSNGGRSDKAKIYFALGTARQGMGNRSAACNAFDNAAYGSFKGSAEHKMEFELKCDAL